MKNVQEARKISGVRSGIITPARRLESLDRQGGIFDRCEHIIGDFSDPLVRDKVVRSTVDVDALPITFICEDLYPPVRN